MLNDILTVTGDNVTIDTKEYRDLVERNAYLNVILGFLHDPKTDILSDVCCVVDVLLNKPVITDEEPENDAVLATATEGADDYA